MSRGSGGRGAEPDGGGALYRRMRQASETCREELGAFYAAADAREASLLTAMLEARERYFETLALPPDERLHVSGKELVDDADLSRGLCAQLVAAVQRTPAFERVDCEVQARIVELGTF